MITLNDICLSFDDKKVIKNLSLELPNRGIVAVSGPSGCGKTTLLRIICGLERPNSGEVIGVPEKISYVFQEHRLIPWISALDNVMQVSECPDAQMARDILGSLGISAQDAELLPSQLSGGMNQRVSIARALCYDADLYLLDEPFTGLDVDNRDKALALFRQKAEKSLIIIVSHNMSELADVDMLIRMESSNENN